MKMHRRSWLRFVGIALAFSLLGAACGSDSPTPAAGDATNENASSSEPAPSVDTKAAALQQGLTDLLGAHVFLAGIAVEQGVLTKSIDSPQFKAAATTLDQNSQDLAGAIASVYGDEAGKQFLSLWRKHITFFVDYTVGGLQGDKAAQAKAKKQLDGYRQDFGAFIDKATGGELSADAAASALQMHVDSLLTTIDAVIAGDANAFDLLYASAHEHMPMTATALAGAIVAQMPEKFTE